MRFTTLSFLLFFAALYLIYWTVSGRLRLHLILIGSLVFYAAWSIPFALHFFGIVGINYLIVRRMFSHPEQRRALMFTAIGINVFNLFLFKYFYLFLQILFDLSGSAVFQAAFFNQWLEATTGSNSITLPLAISFYTFQLIAYVVDVEREQITADDGPLKFFVFVLFFPQLVAGPIMRHSDFFYQLGEVRPREEYMRKGLFLLLIGLIKKVVIADNTIAPIQAVFTAPGEYDGLSNLAATMGFAARVYCDFSGYTDVARGLGFLLGLKLPENFRAPYLSDSVRDLWQRWHITLATWLRDYIYIPLGGSRKGPVRTYVNQIITFTLGGLWHGANYTYIIWGFFHGMALTVERLLIMLRQRIFGAPDPDAPPPTGFWQRSRAFAGKVLAITAVFLAFLVGVVPFNSPDIYSAGVMSLKILSMDGAGLRSPSNDFLVGMLVITFLFNGLQYKREWRLPGLPLQYALLFLLAFITMALIGRYAPGSFDYIYFQF